MSSKIISVQSQIKVPYLEQPKLRNYSLVPEFQYVDGDGVSHKATYRDFNGDPVALTITKDFTFNLNIEVDRHNYKTLLLQLKHDRDLAKHIVVFDETMDIEEANNKIDFEIEILARLKRYRDKGNFPILSMLYRRLFGRVGDLTGEVIYKHLIRSAKEDPEKIHDILEDQDFEVKSVIAQAVEEGYLLKQTGTYKNKAGKVLADGESEMVYYLQTNPEYFGSIKSQIAHSAKKGPVAVEAAKSKIDVEDEFEPELEADNELVEEEKSLTFEDVMKIGLGSVITEQDSGKFKVAGRRNHFTSEELKEYFDKNPEEFKRVTQLIGEAV